jgi:hypothetical protein
MDVVKLKTIPSTTANTLRRDVRFISTDPPVIEILAGWKLQSPDD